MLTKSANKLLRKIGKRPLRFEDCPQENRSNPIWIDLYLLQNNGYIIQRNFHRDGWQPGSYYEIAYPKGTLYLEELRAQRINERWTRGLSIAAILISLAALIVSVIAMQI